jgi:VanZ family protein
VTWPLPRRLILWAPVALLLGYEVYLSSQSTLPSPPVEIWNLDKLEHAAYYFLMAAFTIRALRSGQGWSRGRAAAFTVAAALLYGIADEWHQSFVPRRNADPFDVAADVAGALLAALSSEAIWRRLDSRTGG